MNKELNKKLAEWAGFEFKKVKFGDKVIPQWLLEKEWGHWEPPNFTESLDACFKWLVPNVELVSIATRRAYTGPIAVPNGYWATVSIGALAQDEQADTPALALCLAIEKLIDKEEQDEGNQNPNPTT